MGRTARKKSGSDIYHVIIRGIGKQILFEDSRDHAFFLKTMNEYKAENGIIIYAWCLMDNHVHLLLKDANDKMSLFMKRLQGRYVFYYNHKYERIGNLFQDRFKSEPVETDEYFMTALRYIMQNPEKSGIAKTNEYPWSSYSEYIGTENICHTEFAIELFGSREAVVTFLNTKNDDKCAEPGKPPIRDDRARTMICRKFEVESPTALQTFEKLRRDDALRDLKEIGLTVRQIERLTGINRGIIQRV